jgi:putative membrane-bound dehydrogenase-like protein
MKARSARPAAPFRFVSLIVICILPCCVPASRSASDVPPADLVPFAGLSAQDACDKATLPPGFKMHVFAAEPDLVQPIAFALDDRGRVWVAEGVTYPRRHGNPPRDERPLTPSLSPSEGERVPEGRVRESSDRSKPTPEQLKDILGGNDRILVFEDTDGDHKFDKKTIFMEHLNLVSGLEVGFGGVWIGAAPYLMFVPVKDWDSPKPAGDPQLLLDGWNFTADTHEVLNTFTWGPDGWLYGCHGVFCPSHVGKPGAPESERQWMDAGVWRYHPTHHVFEVFTEGGSNPWGIDFDEHGQLFAEMCVIPHFWHMIQGARIERQGGEHFCINHDEAARNAKYRDPRNRKPVFPFVYEDIKQHGDHVHWSGSQGPHAANARSDVAGGGHAHAGVMCYLGDSWPEEYRGKFLIGNIHGQRLNMDIPERNGSGFVGKHGKDFLNFNDTWSQTLNQLYDQDGSVYIIDWYDKNQCHHTREDGHDRSNGRIYKIVYRNQKTTRVDLAKLSDEELVKLVPSKNEFKSRHARRLLQERAKERGLQSVSTSALQTLLRDTTNASAQLRALWALHVTGGLDARTVIENLKSPDEWVRAWTIQLAFESPENLQRIVNEARDAGLRADPDPVQLAESDSSPVVRLYLAAAAQRAPENIRGRLVQKLLLRGEDAGDHNLPLMVWYALEPLVPDHPREVLVAATSAKLPKILNFTARRIAQLGTGEARDLLAEALLRLEDSAKQLDVLAGMSTAFKGQRSVPMPNGWDAVEAKLAENADIQIRALAQSLSLTFGSAKALAALKRTLIDESAELNLRRAALESLLSVREASLPPLLQQLLGNANLRSQAIRALAGFDDAKTPDTILGVYNSLESGAKRDALNTLTSRAAFAKPLMTAVADGKVPRNVLTAELIRQLRNLKNAEIDQQLKQLYGTIRDSPADKQQEIERYKRIYRAGGSQPGDGTRGRAVFERVCTQCHTLFDAGGKVGPDLTGSNRSDLDYLLQNMIDPNAVIPNDYRASIIETKDGRSMTGIVKQQDDQTVTVATQNEMLALPRNEIASMQQSELSMMPEGLLAPLTDQEVRDLIYYLGRPGQVPLPVEKAGK